MSQQDNSCPYQDVCATTMYWQKTLRNFIRTVCDTKEHEKCTHYVGLNANPMWVHEARRRLDELC